MTISGAGINASSRKDCSSVFPPKAGSTETYLGFIMKCCSVSQSHYSRSDSVSVWRPGKAGVGCTDIVLWSAFPGEDSRNCSKLVFRGFVKRFETIHTVQCLKLPEGHRARFSLDKSYRIWLLEWLNALCRFSLSFSLFSFS